MSNQISNVAVAGATGTIGPYIVSALKKADFNVTILTRQGSNRPSESFESGVTVIPVDYASNASLVSALKGQDAVVSLLSGPAVPLQEGLIRAAVEAGVQRFLPSELGGNVLNSEVQKIPIFGSKIVVQNLLVAESAKNPSFSYTLLVTGPFLDTGIASGLLVDCKNRKATIVSGGNRQFSTTSRVDIGKAVVGILTKPVETQNRAVCVESVHTTQNKLLEMAEKLAATKFEIKSVTAEEIEKLAYQNLKETPGNPGSFVRLFLQAYCFGDRFGSDFADLAENDLLGVRRMTEEELEEMIRNTL